MMLPVKFLDAAEIEAAESIDWYEKKEAGLGRVFRESVEAAIEAIQKNPLAYPIVQGSHVRRILTKQFPYAVIYSVEDNYVLIIAVFHTSRNPIIWRGRTEV